jgi:hypothetical protein
VKDDHIFCGHLRPYWSAAEIGAEHHSSYKSNRTNSE